MARGWGAVTYDGKCVCENKDKENWYIMTQRTVRTGKQYGKVITTVSCCKCGNQWQTSAKYVGELKKAYNVK